MQAPSQLLQLEAGAALPGGRWGTDASALMRRHFQALSVTTAILQLEQLPRPPPATARTPRVTDVVPLP